MALRTSAGHTKRLGQMAIPGVILVPAIDRDGEGGMSRKPGGVAAGANLLG